MLIIRHGDVGLHKVNKTEGEIIKHDGEFHVEYGEVTGHIHRLKVKNKEDLEIRKDAQGSFYFHIKGPATLSHEEHKTIEVPAGIYKKVIERERDWFSLANRKVID
jgi:hypothetical protein